MVSIAHSPMPMAPDVRQLAGACCKPVRAPQLRSAVRVVAWTTEVHSLQPRGRRKYHQLPLVLSPSKSLQSTIRLIFCASTLRRKSHCTAPATAFGTHRFHKRSAHLCSVRASTGDHISEGSEEAPEPAYRVLRLRQQASEEVDRAKLDTTDDAIFYERPRFVQHADDGYREKLTALYRRKLREGSRVLDLMSSWVSHLPEDMSFERIVGHGMNKAELLANTRLDRFWIQDLNKRQHLPHHDGSFDAVLISLGLQYLERPKEVIQEIGRVLAPGGLLIVTFSKHSYTEKAVAGWLRCTAEERLDHVKSMLQTFGFEDIETEISTPELKDRDVSTLSDPFYAVVGVRNKKQESRPEAVDESSTYHSLALRTLSQVEDSGEDVSSSQLLETWANAYEMMANEAVDLGIPRNAIPKLEYPLSRTSITEARDLLSGIIQSRMCSNL